MKLVRKQPQFKEFLNHYPALVNGFLSELIDSESQLNDLVNPLSKHPHDACFHQFKQIVSTHHRFMICGDFDCDGILSTTMLTSFFRLLNKSVGFYIPNRLTEGYGTSLKIVQQAHQKGYDCIIMLDNGVIEGEAHQYCRKEDLTLVVIDHHQMPEPIHATCLIHPDVIDSHYQGSCSSGLVQLLYDFFNLDDDLMKVLAGIGTIGDVMPLLKQNRFVVSEALTILNRQPVEVIEKLLKKPVTWWDAQTIAFQIVPVFNAVGRLSDLGNVNNVVHYLLSKDAISIDHFSRQLKMINQERKNLTASQTQLADTLIQTEDLFHIVAHPHFHPGIVGIIAGRIASNHDKPAIVFTGKTLLKGSVRAQNFDVYQFLAQFKEEYFESFGGHASACALSIKAENFDHFKQRVLTLIKEVNRPEPILEALEFDSQYLTKEAFLSLSDFEPFGEGFKLMPIIMRVLVIEVKTLGQAGYLLKIMPYGEIKEVLYFKQDLKIRPGAFTVDAIGSCQLNRQSELSFIADHLVLVND